MERPRKLRCATIVLIGLVVTSTAQAQWGTTPDGNVSYAFDFTTTGAFSCYGNLGPGVCVASGNRATITRAGITLQVEFNGASVHVRSGDVGVPLGSITTFVSGGVPFAPDLPIPGPLLGFALNFHLTAPGAATRTIRAILEFHPAGMRYASYGNVFSHAYLPTFDNPSRCSTCVVVIENTSPLLIPYDNATSPLTARVGIVPEPSTYALFATGLLAIGGIVRRSRHV